METKIQDEELSRFSDFVARATGLHFPPPRWADLHRAIAATAAELGFEDSGDCIRELISGAATKQQFDALAGHLTVGETYFFREAGAFEMLGRRIIPELLASPAARRRRLRIWSAACCTGEEPYSIAISLIQNIPDWRDWNMTILATDINPRFLRKAEEARFGPWSFRNAPAGLQNRFFQAASDGRLEVAPDVKRLVHFAQMNLADDVYPSPANDTEAFDLIFCRNVLMYFTPATATKVIENLNRAQSEDGWLVVSPSESALVRCRGYRAANLNGVIVYRKDLSRRIESAPAEAIPLATSFIPTHSAPTLALPRSTGGGEKRADRAVEGYASAEALYRAGDYQMAACLLGELLPVRPHDPAILGMLARSMANLGKLSEALRYCDRWITADKLNPASHYLRSVILREQNCAQDAVRSLTKAIYLDPGFVLAHFALANIARGCGRFPEAGKHMDNALRSLRKCRPSDALPESDGITAGRLAEIVDSMQSLEAAI